MSDVPSQRDTAFTAWWRANASPRYRDFPAGPVAKESRVIWDAATRAERERIRPLVEQWRRAADHLASSNAAWSSHFYDCARALADLLGGDHD